MATVSSLSNSALLQALTSNGSSSDSVASLLSATDNTQSASQTSSDQLLQTLVTLSSSKGSSANASAVQTYNAQGLLNQMQAAIPENPLFATDSNGDSSSSGSLLTDVLGSAQGAGNTAGTTGTSTSANLLQLFQQSPTLASAYVQSEITQGIFNDLG